MSKSRILRFKQPNGIKALDTLVSYMADATYNCERSHHLSTRQRTRDLNYFATNNAVDLPYSIASELRRLLS